MSEPSTPSGNDLLGATQELAGEVRTLARSLKVSQQQVRRMRVLTIWAVGLSLLAIVAGGLSLAALHKYHDAQRALTSAQVTNCENANKSRVGQRTLWGFLFDATFEQNKNIDPAQKKFLTDFRAWIDELFKAHDCNDLSRDYPIPPRPAIPAPKG